MRVKAPTKIDGWTKEQLSNKDHGITEVEKKFTVS